MKLYVCQPMEGKTKEEILETRNKAVEFAEQKLGGKPDVLCYQFEHDPDAPVFDFGWSLNMMDWADVVCFCKGWEDDKACWFEHLTAKHDFDVVVIYAE